jgi:hypothetical protein
MGRSEVATALFRTMQGLLQPSLFRLEAEIWPGPAPAAMNCSIEITANASWLLYESHTRCYTQRAIQRTISGHSSYDSPSKSNYQERGAIFDCTDEHHVLFRLRSSSVRQRPCYLFCAWPLNKVKSGLTASTRTRPWPTPLATALYPRRVGHKRMCSAMM